jgi:hypothetical protein
MDRYRFAGPPVSGKPERGLELFLGNIPGFDIQATVTKIARRPWAKAHIYSLQ